MLQAFRSVHFQKRDSNAYVSCGYGETFKNYFFDRATLVAASESPTSVQ